MKALYSSWSRTGSSCSVAAWAWRVIVRNRIRSGSSPSVRVELLRSTRTPRSAIRRASASATPGTVEPRWTKSAFGSKTAIRRSVCSRSRSRSTPSAYVLPDPLWPQRKVCRLNPPARRLASAPDVARAPGADRQGSGGRAVQAAELGGPGEAHGGPAERRPVAALHRARLAQGADDDTEPGQGVVTGRLHDVDDLAQDPDRLGRGDDDHVTRCHPVGRVGVERESPSVPGLGRCLTRRHRVLLSRPTGRGGRVDVVPRTSWRMPSTPRPARRPARAATGSMTASRGTPQHTWSPRA